MVTNETGIITASNGHAVKIDTTWFHKDSIEVGIRLALNYWVYKAVRTALDALIVLKYWVHKA